jgi:hypothetical protein
MEDQANDFTGKSKESFSIMGIEVKRARRQNLFHQ